MPIYIRLEDDTDIDILKRMFDKVIAKIKSDPSRYIDDSIEGIMRIHDSLHNAGSAAQMLPKAAELTNGASSPVKRKRRTKAEIEADAVALPNLCAQHPKYTAKIAPKIDCKGCWSAYKRFEPMQYDKKRRDFIRTCQEKQV